MLDYRPCRAASNRATRRAGFRVSEGGFCNAIGKGNVMLSRQRFMQRMFEGAIWCLAVLAVSVSPAAITATFTADENASSEVSVAAAELLPGSI